MWGTYLEQMVKKSILLQFVVGSPIWSPICTGLVWSHLHLKICRTMLGRIKQCRISCPIKLDYNNTCMAIFISWIFSLCKIFKIAKIWIYWMFYDHLFFTLTTRSWLNWVNEDDWGGWGWLERKARRHLDTSKILHWNKTRSEGKGLDSQLCHYW